MQVIPVNNLDSQSFTTVLDNQRLRFFINYQINQISGKGAWYADIELLTSTLANSAIIALGLRLATFQSPTARYVSSLPGAVYVIPVSVPFEDLEREDAWGNTHQLVYFDETETRNLRATI